MALSLASFAVERILSQDQRTKSINVLGRFNDKDGQAVVLISRKAFDCTTEGLQKLLSDKTQLEQHFNNDIYSKYDGLLPADLGKVNIDIIFPATEKHIQKYSEQQFYLVRETPEQYAEVTKPYIDNIPAARIQWVYNILAKKAEAERLIFEDPDPETGFMLHPDMKWDLSQATSLYCIVLCHRRDIRSLRDLTQAHLPLLRNIQRKTLEVLESKFSVAANQIRAYVHHQPSYYHFHVHFAHTSLDLGGGGAVGKAHLLDDIIDNLATFGGEYYAKRTLTFSLGGNDALLEAFNKRKAAAPADED